jgi:hypothetical protein
MYRNCPPYKNGKLFKNNNDEDVLTINPILSQKATVKKKMPLRLNKYIVAQIYNTIGNGKSTCNLLRRAG